METKELIEKIEELLYEFTKNTGLKVTSINPGTDDYILASGETQVEYDVSLEIKDV
jgi:hypothetical protein